MIVYAESSAVLSWLLGVASGEEVKQVLAGAEFIVTSDLTLVECDRALHRARALGELSAERFAALHAELDSVSAGWTRLRLSDEVVQRARGAFPEEPIRSLDALHLASAVISGELLPGLVLLSLDERLRQSGRALGLSLRPSSP